uniref:Uncharacterized protein n=1 Tax=Nelumbo nucifera TaxID=4432 RepID=A0A822XXP0_NELNU|nr:TPA_asm: hypothetical protein HUJ06_023621 [Nelumbo nucifera]
MFHVCSPNLTSFTVEGLTRRKSPPLEAFVHCQIFPSKLSSDQALYRSTESLLCYASPKLSSIQALHRSTEGLKCCAPLKPSKLFTAPPKYKR